MQSEARFYGKAQKYAVGASVSPFDPRFARLHFIEAAAGTWTLTLTTAGVARGTFFIAHNLAASAGSVVVAGSTIAPGATRRCFFSGSAWVSEARPFGTAGGVVFTPAPIYVVGGTGTSGSSVKHNVALNTWSAGPSAANAKIEAAGALFGNKGNFIGSDPIAVGTSEKNDEIDKAAAAFVNRTNYLTTVRRAQAARAVNASSVPAIFVYGGDAAAGVASYVFDAWTVQAALPIRRARGVAVAVARQDRIEARVFLLSGDNPLGQATLGHLPRADFYWATTIHAGASRHSVAGFARAGRVHQVGGYIDSPVTRLDLNEEYDPATDSWTTRAALSLGTRYAGAGATGTARGYYCGGRDGADAQAAGASSYARDSWSAILAMPAVRSEVRASGVGL